MSSLEHYARAFERLPASARTDARRGALSRLLELGLPTTAHEDWKYTDLSSVHELAPDGGDIDGEAPARLDADADGVDALNAAFAGGGLQLDVPAGSHRAEIIVAGGNGHRRHHVRLGRGAQARLRLDVQPHAAFQTVVLDIELDAGAQLTMLRLQDAGADARHLTRVRARLGRDTTLDLSTVDLGGRLSRHDLVVDLAEPGAQVHLRGLFVASGDGHIDNHTRFDHRAPHGTSRETVRGLARDAARGVFNGKIVVHPGAQKTDSEQRVANLILSPKAEINAKPELEIYADDVKCAHGATFGQLDLTALFYLRSRGLPEADARALLTLAFAMEPLRAIPDADFRREAIGRVSAHLGASIEEMS
ncbi:MAG: sufD [Panacagrimonas sp.]|jgi:Fe-S cluster assembly protein SufD|nr:Fe-S cluster assembly protein SufD [Panacagrimonas sp.]MCC2656196.1 sufD [Panacagrimonas sp.]